MARLRTIGCEIGHGGANAGTVFEGYAVGTVVVDATTKRSGASSFKCGDTTSAQHSFEVPNLTGTVGQVFARCFYLVPSASGYPTALAKIMRFADSAGTSQVSVRMATDGSLELWNDVGNVKLGSSSAIVGQDTWFCLEVGFTPAAAGSAAVTARLGFSQFATGTALTVNANAVYRVGCGFTTAAGASKFINIDDVAINDATGAAQNTWPGDGHIIYLLPVSDSARIGWTTGAGGTTSLFAALDNKPPTGVALASATATSQIKDLANNATDAYTANMTDYTTAGLPTGATVVLVQPAIDVGQDSATATSFVYTIVTNPVGGANTGTAAATIAGTWPAGWLTAIQATGQSRWGAAIIAPAVTVGTQPTMSVRKNTASATITQMVDGMFIAVEYMPAVSLPTRPKILRQAVQRVATR